MAEQLNRVGEVIEASTTVFTAQCYELYGSPALGSLVKTGDGTVEQYGIVYETVTAGIEPGRRPIARGKDESDEEDVYKNNPQLLKLLRTEFSSLVVGYRGDIRWDSSKPDGAPRKLLDVTRLHELGWRHRIGLEEGLRSLYEAFLDGRRRG